MRKVCVFVTARPSYSRIKTALEAIVAHPDLTLQLVVCGSALLERFGNVSSTIESDGFTIDEKLYTIVESGNSPIGMAKTTGLAMAEISTTLARLGPDIVVTIADRYETLATAAAASYMNIPLAHVQGGEFSGSIDDKVRGAITRLADIHLVATRQAARNVLQFLWDQKSPRVYVTGCPSIDLAKRAREDRAISAVMRPDFMGLNFKGVGAAIDYLLPFAVVLQHPVTDAPEEAYFQAAQTLLAIQASEIQAVWFWPNVDAGSDGTSKALRALREDNPDAPIHFLRGLPPEQFIRLANRSACIVGNSSFGIREASYLGLPVVNIGNRQRGRERAANVVDVDHDVQDIAREIRRLSGERFPCSELYGSGHAGESIADILARVEI